MKKAMSVCAASFVILFFWGGSGLAQETFPNAGLWLAHWQEDIRPFWDNAAAMGDPEGNYPTFRNQGGKPTSESDRYSRMLSRQVYTYSIGYALTGDGTLLQKARAGIDWLLAHAKHPQFGYYPILDEKGRGRAVRGVRSGIKWNGSLWGDNEEWESKAHFWKNGYHETEHALVLYLLSCQLQEQLAVLYFAVPAEKTAAFQPQPYLFQGQEISRADLGAIKGTALKKLKIGFDSLH